MSSRPARQAAAKAAASASRRIEDSSDDDEEQVARGRGGRGDGKQGRGRPRVEPSSGSDYEEDDDNEDPVPSTSTQQQHKGAGVTVRLDDTDLKLLSADAVFWILAQERKRAPFKRADVIKAVGLSGRARDAQERVWELCRNTLGKTFGLGVQEQRDDKKGGLLFLYNKLRESEDKSEHFLKWSPRENAHTGLLFSVLALIFMSNDVVSDEELFAFLKQLGVHDDGAAAGANSSRRDNAGIASVPDDIRDIFGDVRNLVFKEWGQRQCYLDIKKVDTGDTDHEKHEIRWGTRAKMEVTKSSVLAMISNMYGVSPKAFKAQYDQVIKDEGEKGKMELDKVGVDDEDEDEDEEGGGDATMEEDESGVMVD